MAIRTKKYRSVGGLLEVRAIKITEKNIEDLNEYILRNGGVATVRLARPAIKRPARIRIKQHTAGKTWSKRDWRVALIGDYIVRHEDGEFARVKAGAFNALYTAI